VSVNGIVAVKMRTFKGECAQFSFNKCPIYTYDSASAKLSTISQETENGQQYMHKKEVMNVSEL
jgi:hypothetical protein